MPYANDALVVTKAVRDKLDLAKDSLGIKRVFLGRQELIPDFPAITVETGPKVRRHLNMRQFGLTFSVLVSVFHEKVQSGETNDEENQALAELVEDALHNDFSLGGLVVFGFVTRFEPLTLTRADVMMRVTQLTWQTLDTTGGRETF